MQSEAQKRKRILGIKANVILQYYAVVMSLSLTASSIHPRTRLRYTGCALPCAGPLLVIFPISY